MKYRVYCIRLRKSLKMSSDAGSYLSKLPTEVLMIIFTMLPAKNFILCRRVCVKFKEIVDRLSQSEACWRDYCKNDFGSVYKIARRKTGVGMHWFNIYKSLSLWPKLSQAKEFTYEHEADPLDGEGIKNFKILRDGIISVHTESAIAYYNIETMKKSERSNITGTYKSYAENEDTIIVLSYELGLSISRKVIKNPSYENNVTFDNVKTFILVDREVYYVNCNDEIYVCELDDGNLSHRLVCRSSNTIMCLGYSNKLHFLTSHRNIYTVDGQELVCSSQFDPYTNMFHILNQYNFHEHVDWITSTQWVYYLNQPATRKGIIPDITAFRIYGDMVFVGTHWGVLLIYHIPLLDEEFNPFNFKPVKKYDFVKNFNLCSPCPIIQIDVSESIDGHIVLIATKNKIISINYTHNFKGLPAGMCRKQKILDC